MSLLTFTTAITTTTIYVTIVTMYLAHESSGQVQVLTKVNNRDILLFKLTLHTANILNLCIQTADEAVHRGTNICMLPSLFINVTNCRCNHTPVMTMSLLKINKKRTVHTTQTFYNNYGCLHSFISFFHLAY